MKEASRRGCANLRRDIEVLIACIRAELDKHAKRGWSAAANLAHIRGHLKEVLQKLLLSQRDYAWKVDEASRFIEYFLAIARKYGHRH